MSAMRFAAEREREKKNALAPPLLLFGSAQQLFPGHISPHCGCSLFRRSTQGGSKVAIPPENSMGNLCQQTMQSICAALQVASENCPLLRRDGVSTLHGPGASSFLFPFE